MIPERLGDLARTGLVLAFVACVPTDEALGLGSVQFTFTASTQTKSDVYDTTDHYRLHFDRVILSLRTMTVGKIGAPDTCSYRGRGAVSNAVFSPLGPAPGLVQTFNGISPVECPDVGAIFSAPTDVTVVDANATSKDLVELAQSGLHALVDVTATPVDGFTPPTSIRLRFHPATTATRFGGCRAATGTGGVDGRGTRILEGERDEATVFFAAENLFRDALTSRAALRARPFVQADELGDNDGVATMAELDQLPLTAIREGEFYRVPTSATSSNVAGAFPSLGDFVRFLFRYTLLFRSEFGLCSGNEPGTE